MPQFECPNECPNCGVTLPIGSKRLNISIPNWVWIPFSNLFPEDAGPSEMVLAAVKAFEKKGLEDA
jgi:hypothetical protein